VKSCAVFIATTGGAVQVLQITPERAPQSMVCQNRTTNVLPVSSLYDQFVKPGSGIVEREFGPFDNASFRVDVSGPIDTGNSWQLGMFLAHALGAAPDHRLIEDIAAADEILWATGCVDYHLNVTEVDHVAAKIRASAQQFQDWAGMGKTVTLITAAGANEDDSRAALAGNPVQIFGAENAWQAGEILGLAGVIKSRPEGAAAASPGKSGSVRNVALAALAVVLIGGASLAALAPEKFARWSQRLMELTGAPVAQEQAAAPTPAKSPATIPKPAAPAPKPTPPPAIVVKPPPPVAPPVPVAKPSPPPPRIPEVPKISVAISRLAPPAGGTCMQVHFGGADPVLKPVAEIGAGGHRESDRASTCGLSFELGGTGKYLAVHLRVISGRFVQASQKPASLSGSQPVTGVQTWTIQLPQKAKEPFSYELAVLSSDQPLAAQLKRLRGLENFKGAFKELAQNQINLVVHSHRVSAQ
jgi:hypothetical protein